MENMFEIGVITKPQGITGEMRILPTTDDPSRFSLLDELYVRDKMGRMQTYKVQSARQQKNIVIIKLDGITTRNHAEEMVGSVLLIPPEKALPLGDDEYYVRDLIGLQVETQDGELLGTINKTFPTGANDVYVVRDGDGNSFMIPAVKDVILNVSIPEKKVVVRLMEGLLELTT